MAISVSVDRSGVFGDLRYSLSTVTFDDADASTAIDPADVGFGSTILFVGSGVTDGGYVVSYDAAGGELAIWEGDDGAPLASASTTDADGEFVTLLFLGL